MDKAKLAHWCEVIKETVLRAVLVHVPHGQMAYWVSAANVETAD